MSEKLEKQIKSAFDNMLEGCQIIGFDWRYIYLNDSAARQGKKKKEELLGKTMMEMYPGIDKTDLFARLQRVMSERSSDYFENYFEFPDKTKGWFELRIEPFPEGIFILSLDITASKIAENKLRASEEKYKVLIENIPDVTWIADKNGNVIFISPHIKDIGGFTDKEIYEGGFAMTFGQIHEEDIARAHASYETLFINNEKIDDEFRFRKKDGSWAWLHLKSLNKYEKDGITYAIGLLSDVTGAREAKIKIKELDELKTKFIQIINHQMRTPLSVIRWTLENLISGARGEISDPILQNLQIISDTNSEIIKRLNDLLTALDIKEGRVAIQQRELSFEGLISGILGEFKKPASFKNISITYNSPAKSLPLIEADPEKLRDACQKIIENAVIYTENNGKINISLKQEGSKIKFEVMDSGIGIPAPEQKHVFTLFFRASNAFKMKPDASGVGLAISKYFIEQHGGSVEFVSVEGGGSRFWIELPIIKSLKQK